MRFFHRLAADINVAPLALALARNGDLWNQNTFRTTFPNTPHVDVDDIWLRFSDPEKCDTTSNVIGDDKPIWYPAAKRLPEVMPIVRDLMFATNAYELGRLLISRMPPGGKILPHKDDAGHYVNMGNIARYHVVIQGYPGSMYYCGNEEVAMLTGEAWWFDAHSIHHVLNNSAEDRIHLLVDLLEWPR